VLDEMPFGEFMEIEGPDPASIQDIAGKLGLNWEARCRESYMGLFQRLQVNRKLDFRDLTFSNFSQVKVKPEEMAVMAAD